MKKTISSVFLDAMIKNYKGKILTPETRYLLILLSDRFDIKISPPPEPYVELTFQFRRRLELESLERPEVFTNILKEIVRAIYFLMLDKWVAKSSYKDELSKIIKLKNVDTEVKASSLNLSGDKIKLIIVKAYSQPDYLLNERVTHMITEHVKEKEKISFTKSMKALEKGKYLNEHLYVFNEIKQNNFINDDGLPVYSLRVIENYLKKRLKQKPVEIKCKWCHKTVFKFNPKRAFCYRPGCPVSASRNKKNGN